MKHIQILIFLIFWFSNTIKAQTFDKDSIIVCLVYNDTLWSVNESNEKLISSNLMSYSLDELVDKEIISRVDMAGFALPLGVFKNDKPVNFTAGMIDMWQSKARFLSGKSDKMRTVIMQTALQAVDENIYPKGQMTLRNFRDSVISTALAEIKILHKGMHDLYSPERAVFMDIIANNLSENILLGYNIQEMIPPTHMTQSGEIKSINPIFKAYFYDRLLREAGTSFIQYFPARYDTQNSYGPFQLTQFAVKDILVNNRLTDNFRKFNSMNELLSINDHVLAAALFSYNNWERLSYNLQADGTIKKFNEYFKDYEKNQFLRRQLRIFISGITACMHHQPTKTRSVVRKYIKETDSFDKIHYELIKKNGNKQLRKYYKSSAEAYLIMKVYHKLIEEYGE